MHMNHGRTAGGLALWWHLGRSGNSQPRWLNLPPYQPKALLRLLERKPVPFGFSPAASKPGRYMGEGLLFMLVGSLTTR